MTTIAVTGASGFCGSHVAEAAAAHGARVRCVGRRPGPVGRHVPWDATGDPPQLDDADLVVHCAAAVGDPPPGAAAEAHMRAVNVLGTARLLAAAEGRPVVWVSSASVYAPDDLERPLSEETPTHGQLNAYGRTKAAGEALALSAGAVVLRPRAVYGAGDPHLVPRLLARVRRGQLLLPGPSVPLSLTAVENLTDACLAAADWPAGAYNIVDPTPYDRDTAIGSVLSAHGSTARLRHLPRPLARAAARTLRVCGRLRPDREPALTPYAVDQLARSVVLDTTKAQAQGYRGRHTLDDYTAALAAA